MQFNAKHYIFAMLVAVILGLGIWYAKSHLAQNLVSGVVSSPADVLQNASGRTGVVLLGVGGDGHAGGDLTDSILFLSFNLASNTAIMIPIPRDIWIPSLQAKINTAYHYGNLARSSGGRDLIKSAVAETLGVPVHYVLALDFQGFVQAIDAVGGLDVEVTRSFDDFKYPIPGQETVLPESDRYQHIHFDQGLNHMDGATALKFARSRYAVGEEGTDFARASRQEKIILAFRAKVFSKGTIFNSTTMNNLKDSLTSSIDTDIDAREQGSFVKVLLALGNQANIKSLPLTDYLENPKSTKDYGGQWVLIPTPSLQALQSYVKTNLAE